MSSQTLLHSRRFVLTLCAAFLMVVGCLTVAASVQAQTPAATPSRDATPDATREDRELNEARRRNEDAQAEYYRTQTEKLNQPALTKSFWRTLSDNAAILGALTAAVVALFTLIVNQRNALRARKDTEFYEALKRFGDKDSPTVRASAAAMLAQISDHWFYTFPRRRPDKRWKDLEGKLWQKVTDWLTKRVKSYPYFETALGQLVTGLLIEEHAVVVHATVTAVKRISPRNTKLAAERLYDSNLRLTTDMVTFLAEFFAAKGATKPDQVGEKVWKEVTNLTRGSLRGLKAIVALHGSWEEGEKITDVDKKQIRIEGIKSQLRDLGRRLNQNVKLCSMVLSDRPKSATDSLNFFHAYLPNAYLVHANLRNIDFSRALMGGAFLMYAKMGGAKLEGTILEGSHWELTDLTDTKLYDVGIDKAALTNDRVEPPLAYSNWWCADYWKVGGVKLVDEDLIEKLILRFGLSHDILTEAHPSVKEYIAERNRLEQAETASQDSPSPPPATS